MAQTLRAFNGAWRLRSVIAQILGEGLSLAVIHGFGVDHRIMLPLQNSIDESGWQRIYIDLPWAAENANVTVSSSNHVAHGAMTGVPEHSTVLLPLSTSANRRSHHPR
jgi:hypothetical protein